MAILDISIVLYRVDIEGFSRTLRSLSLLSKEFRCARILVSGSREEHDEVAERILAFRLEKKVDQINRFDNIGFASGHNLLMRRAFELGANYCLVLNPDVEIEISALKTFVERCEGIDGGPGIYGPTLERMENVPSISRSFDSAGIVWTSSGRHFDARMGSPWQISDGAYWGVSGVTGACMLVSDLSFRRLVSATGWFFDDFFLAYREDAELGIRAGLCGVRSFIISMEGFRHVRSVRGARRGGGITDLLGVRNRFAILLRLGKNRPGSRIIAWARDTVAIMGVFCCERSSIPGLIEVFRARRFLRYTSVVREIDGRRTGSY